MALLVTALPAASAVEAEPLSDYAGKTMTVQVSHVRGDGEVTKDVVHVDIPRRASKNDEQELIHAAVSSVTKTSTTTRSVVPPEVVGSNGKAFGAWAPITVTTSFSTPISPIELDRDYDSVWFQFHSGTWTGDPTILTLKIVGSASDGATSSKTIFYDLGGDSTEKANVNIVIVDGKSYQGTTAHLWGGDAFEFSCKVNRGSVKFGGLVIWGYYD